MESQKHTDLYGHLHAICCSSSKLNRPFLRYIDLLLYSPDGFWRISRMQEAFISIVPLFGA